MAQASKRRKLSNGEAMPSSLIAKEANPAASNLKTSKHEANDQRRSLFVRSLPASVTTELLTEHFSQSYPLKHATVVLDKATGISRGFGFVTFADAEDAQNAVSEFNDSMLGGRKIKVELAESRHREVEEDLVTGRTKGGVNVKGQELRAVRQQQLDDSRPPKLIVRNLPWSIKTGEDLTKLFLSYGKVKHAVVPTLPQKVKGGAQPQAGFGIVILRGKKNAERALQGVNGKEVDGRVLAVDWAVDKETWNKVKEGQEESVDSIKTTGNDMDPSPKPVADEKQVMDDETSSEGSELGIEDINGADDNEDGEGIASDNDMSEEGIESDDISDLEGAADAINSATTRSESDNTTIFIRNLPFTADDDSLYAHFKTNFGPVRYARVVYDHDTERSRGTGFVSFYAEDVARNCVKKAPKRDSHVQDHGNDKKRRGEVSAHSLLQDEMSDPSGKYTLEGRVLQITRALPKGEADRRADESSQKRSENKRRLYLLSEGTIPKGSQLYDLLGKAEIDIRESSSRQRQKMVKENPNLGLSLTRLSVRNLPRSVTSKDLKALAREAIVGFATDIKQGKRQPLSKEELTRGGEEEKELLRMRKEKGKGIVKQIKIVFESEKSGGKVSEGKGGRSRGYGFIEYYGHRYALMGLRWLNGHLIKVQSQDGGDRNKRLIVEFAIENAQVVQRRAEREQRARDGPVRRPAEEVPKKRKREDGDDGKGSGPGGQKERKQKKPISNEKPGDSTNVAVDQDEKNKVAARNRIIAQKRHKRKVRKGKA